MEMTFINVGYGDAILLVDNGFKMLVDGGSANPDEYNGFKSRIRSSDYLKKAGITELDFIVITHIHEDHVCGLEDIIAAIKVKKIGIPYPPALFLSGKALEIGENSPKSAKMFTCALNTLRNILLKAKENGIPVEELYFDGEEKVIPLTSETSLTVLAPEKGAKEEFLAIVNSTFEDTNPLSVTEKLVTLDRTSNDVSLLLKIAYKGKKILLAADSCPRCWGHIKGKNTLKADVLKLPHHGQADSISEETIAQISPGYVVTTSASDRRYNSANKAVYEKITEFSQKGTDTVFLFTDERSYDPYFKQQNEFNGVKLIFQDNKIRTEFILHKND